MEKARVFDLSCLDQATDEEILQEAVDRLNKIYENDFNKTVEDGTFSIGVSSGEILDVISGDGDPIYDSGGLGVRQCREDFDDDWGSE